LSIAPSALCTDVEFIRRAYLDVCGILPTAEEVRDFVAESGTDKRARLIDGLLERPEYADFWTLKWADVLRVNRKFIQPTGAKVYHAWLRSAVKENRPFDQVVRELLTSMGHSYRDPPANYYCVVREPTNPEDLIQHDLAETTSQLFLGIRMKCAKCHNHPLERWSQDDYYGLAAFFTQIKQHREGKFGGVGNPEHRPVSVSLDPNAKELIQPRSGKLARPKVLGGPVVTVPLEQDRRALLADWLARGDNPFFARSFVNRLWFHLLGRGIVDPVDDFRDSNPSANDALLDTLAQDFVACGFNVKHVLRVILNSRTYQLSARTNDSNKEDAKYFSHALVKPLTAEQLFDALCTATGVSEPYEGFPLGTRATQLPDGEVVARRGTYLNYDRHPFMKTFGQPDRELACECARETDFSLTQAMEMLNGPTVTAKLLANQNRIGQMLSNQIAPRGIVTNAGDPRCIKTAGWSDVGATAGYTDASYLIRPGSGAETVTWQANALKPGSYIVQATWMPGVKQATNAPYQIYDGEKLLRTVRVNQKAAPAGMTTIRGVVFQSLGMFAVNSGMLKIVLSDQADEYVHADAVHVTRPWSDAEFLDELYLTTLSRLPSEPAAKAFLGHVARAGDRRKAWEDVLWTILRSKEFIYRH
jgi:hypothetical protein